MNLRSWPAGTPHASAPGAYAAPASRTVKRTALQPVGPGALPAIVETLALSSGLLANADRRRGLVRFGQTCDAAAMDETSPPPETAIPDRPAQSVPFFDVHVFVCTNRRPDGHRRGSCAARGSERLRDLMKVRAKELGTARVRINAAGCLDRCELGPCVVVYPAGLWYRIESEADVDLILAEYLLGAARPEQLLLPA